MSDDTRDRDGKWLPGAPPVNAGRRWAKGESGNPGGKLKRVRECQELALQETPASFQLLIDQRNDTEADPRVRQAAAKLLIAYGIGDPPKEVRIESDRGDVDPMDALSIDELRALARQSLADDAPEPDDAGDDDSDETEH